VTPRQRREPDVTSVLAVRPEPAAIRQVRHAVARLLVSWELAEICDDAVLCLSEALTNAILHARPTGTVTVTIHRDLRTLRIEIADTGRGIIRPDPGCPADPDALRPVGELAEHGWGLRVIDALAARWGVDADDAGKRVWFEQDIPPIGRIGVMP
jgi:anti-sigma regulatory factor (Ser/Thr protein kinase)